MAFLMTIFFWLGGLIVGLVAVAGLIFLLTVLIGAPYVPTHQRQLRRLFSADIPLGADDLLVDLGSGDGVVLKVAAEHGAQVRGYEINPILVWISRRRLAKFGSRVKVRTQDYRSAKFPIETTIFYIFSESRDIAQLAALVERHVQTHQRPVWLVSYGFEIAHFKQIAAQPFGAFFCYRITPESLQREKP